MTVKFVSVGECNSNCDNNTSRYCLCFLVCPIVIRRKLDFIPMTSINDGPKVFEGSLKPYPHSERGSEVRRALVIL
jgi:hypothetical protein